MPLPLRLRTHAGEPPHGVLLRLAARHREPDLRAFATAVGLSHGAVLLGRQADRVAALAGVDAAVLSRHSAAVDVPRRLVSLAGQLLLLNDWSTKRRRWCPECLAEDRIAAAGRGEPREAACWHRACWDVRSVDSCATHRVGLSDACPACGAAQGWRGPSVDACACGADLAGSPAVALAGPGGAASAYASARLGFSSTGPVPLVDDLTLKDALTAFERLGECAMLGHRLHKTEGAMPAPGAARDAGVMLARSWPGSFVAILDAVLRDGRRAGGASGLIGAYGWIYSDWAAGDMPAGFESEVRKILAEHAVLNGIVPPGEPMFGAAPGRSTTITAAARTLGLGFAGARRLLDADGLVHAAVRRGVAAPVAPDAVLAIREQLDGQIGIAGVGLRLGTARTQTRALVGHGLLEPVVGTASTRRFAITAVDAFMAQLAAGAADADPASSRLSPLPRACKAKGVRLAAACGAVVAGDLRVEGIDSGAVGLRRLLVRPGDVGRLRPDRGLTMEEASAALGIHGDATRWLVRQGVLATIAGRGTTNVAEASVRRFRERYVRAVEVAGLLGRSPKSTVAMLARAGIVAAFGPPGCRQALFERADAARFLARAGTMRLATRGAGAARNGGAPE